eukprot:7428907-Pyramimonas_sp.AAC.1
MSQRTCISCVTLSLSPTPLGLRKPPRQNLGSLFVRPMFLHAVEADTGPSLGRAGKASCELSRQAVLMGSQISPAS